MNPVEQQPMESPELEVISQLSFDANEKLTSIETSTEAQIIKQDETTQAIKDLEPILDAQFELTKMSTDRIVEALDKTASVPQRFEQFLNEFKGEKGEPGADGYSPVRGKDYFTESEINQFLKQVTPIKGKDYFTAQEIASMLEKATPRKGIDYTDGVNGKDGRTPIFVSNKEPIDAQVGDLWYQP